MEEIINKLTLTYIGNINGDAYFNVEYVDGFTDDTKLVVADTCTCCELASETLYNVAKYDDNTTRTLKIVNVKDEVTNFTIRIYEGTELVEEDIVSSDSSNVPALIKENVHVNSIGDRIIEILFDEPVQNLEANFDFGQDYFNRHPLFFTDKANIILKDSNTPTQYFYKKQVGENSLFYKFATDSDGIEDSTNDEALLPVTQLSTPSVSTEILLPFTPIYLDLSLDDKLSIPLTRNIDTSEYQTTSTYDSINSAYTFYQDQYINATPSERSVLVNYYFRYFGSDDEGTLYEPADKPIDWLGYFSGGDVTTTVSKDNRRIQIQFDHYSLPTGDTHQLIINYAKTFPDYPGNLRILDTNKNPFPIVRELSPIDKLATKAIITDVVALSKDEILITYDKAVLCQHDHGKNIITINGTKPENISRYENSYNILLCKLSTDHALDVGDEVFVEIGSITDACGYTTTPYSTTIPVVAVPPEVISLKQGETTKEGLETIIDIEFTDSMMDLSGDISNFFEIFKIVDGIKEIIYPTIMRVNQSPNTTLKISVTEPILYPGFTYEINISDMENTYKTVMIPYTGILHIKDMSAPTIKGIYLTDHSSFDADSEGYKIAVIFNEPMTSTGSHSLTDYTNYAITLGKGIANSPCPVDPNIPNTKNIKVPLNADNCIDVVPLKENTIARICLNKDYFLIDGEPEDIGFIPNDLVVKAGHCELKEVKYLTNLSNNVLNFVCPLEEVLSEKIDLLDAVFTVVNNETLVVKYSAIHNEIIALSASAFTLTDGTLAIDAVINSNEQFTLTFPEDTFFVGGKKLYFLANGEDLFGNSIFAVAENIAIKLDYDAIPTLQKAYLYYLHSDAAIFALEFSEAVKKYGNYLLAGKDYSVSVNGGHYRSASAVGRLVDPEKFNGMYVETVAGGNKTLFLQFNNTNEEIFFPDDKFTLSVATLQEHFKTLDYITGKPVEIFRGVDANARYPQVGSLISNFATSSTNLVINYASSINKPLDEYPDINTVSFESLNIIKIGTLEKPLWEINYAAEPLFNSFKLTVKVDPSTNISLGDASLNYNEIDGSYILSIAKGSGSLNLDEIVNIELGFNNGYTTVEGTPTLNHVIDSINTSTIASTFQTSATNTDLIVKYNLDGALLDSNIVDEIIFTTPTITGTKIVYTPDSVFDKLELTFDAAPTPNNNIVGSLSYDKISKKQILTLTPSDENSNIELLKVSAVDFTLASEFAKVNGLAISATSSTAEFTAEGLKLVATHTTDTALNSEALTLKIASPTPYEIIDKTTAIGSLSFTPSTFANGLLPYTVTSDASNEVFAEFALKLSKDPSTNKTLSPSVSPITYASGVYTFNFALDSTTSSTSIPVADIEAIVFTVLDDFATIGTTNLDAKELTTPKV